MLRPFGSPRWVDEGYTSTNAHDSLVGVVVRIDVEGTTRLSLGCRVVRCVRGSSPLCVRRSPSWRWTNQANVWDPP